MKMQAGFAAVFLAIVTCLWFVGASSKRAEAQPPLPPSIFEYKFERITLEGIASRLNAMAREYWEYVDAKNVNGSPDQYILIVKRPNM